MVRYLVGTMIEIARKRYNYNDFLELLNDQKECSRNLLKRHQKA